jgi:hypothetical protein
MEETEDSGAKIDVAGARGTADVDNGMSSSSGMEGIRPGVIVKRSPYAYVTTDVTVVQDLTLGETQSL